jgi:hypothetical protein
MELPTPSMPSASLVARIRSEYREMPGLQLTFAQARLLWQLDAPTCSAVLQMLIDEGFLSGRPDGRFIAVPTDRMHAKASESDLTPNNFRRLA